MLDLGERERFPHVSSISKEARLEKQLTLAIVTDADTVGLSEGLKTEIDRSNHFIVSSGRFIIETATARKAIQLLNPRVVFVTTLLGLAKDPSKINEMKFRELVGFVHWLNSYRSPIAIVAQTPPLGENKIGELFETGVTAWVSTGMANEALGQVLWGLATGKGVIFSQGVVEPGQLIRRGDYNFPKSPNPQSILIQRVN